MPRKPIGQLLSDALARARAGERSDAPATPFRWHTQPMVPRVDLEDAEEVGRAMEQP